MKEDKNVSKLQIASLLVSFLLFVGFIVSQILSKEKIRNEGTLVFLPLMPVDPRSLFQGDYMILRYNWDNLLNKADSNAPKRGCLVFTIQEQILTPVRLQKDSQPRAKGEHCIQFFKSSFEIKIGAESYFFQEGEANLYANAKFAGIRFIKEASSFDKLLVGLYDEKKNPIEPSKF
ncbi:GDYXXLXY domain-containing protein [Leptospira sp. 96542]|nr:GDYXXLXY domain-containing protein [Leptospira sp. 96542]